MGVDMPEPMYAVEVTFKVRKRQSADEKDEMLAEWKNHFVSAEHPLSGIFLAFMFNSIGPALNRETFVRDATTRLPMEANAEAW